MKTRWMSNVARWFPILAVCGAVSGCGSGGDYEAVDMAQMAVVVKARITTATMDGSGLAAKKEGVVESLTIMGKSVAIANGEFKIAGPSPEFYVRTEKYGKVKFTYRTADSPGMTHVNISDNLLLWLTATQKKAFIEQASR